MMTNRFIAAKPWSVLRRVEKAINGMAKAIPVRAATGTPGISPQSRASGKQASTSATHDAATVQRTAIHSACPPTMSPGPSGVAEIP